MGVRVEQSDRLPQCSRCRGALIISTVMPQNDREGRPILMELCPACDADKGAASALIRLLDSPDSPNRMEEAADLLLAWTREAMADYGWFWEPTLSSPN